MFKENHKLLGDNHQAIIENETFLVVGAGGLGGFISNALTRLGAKHIIIVDYDTYDESNLNRQLFSHQATIGKYKADVVKEELLKISPTCHIEVFKDKIENIVNHPSIKKTTMLFDAVDSIKTRLFLENFASQKNIPFFHGAIGGWYGQVAIIEPHVYLLKDLYGNKEKGVEKTLGSPTFIPPIVANLMVSECMKYLHKEEELLLNKLLFIDIKNHTYQIVFDKSKT